MGYNDHLLAVGVIFACFDAFGIGANDVANSFSTAVNSGVLTMLQVAILAPLLEFGGAVGVGKDVASTISKNILDANKFKGKAGLLQMAMVCALIGSSSWLHIANMAQFPVSTTHSIIGGVIGTGVAAFGINGINWWGYESTKCGDSNGYFAGICATDNGFGPIAISWIAAPLLSAAIAMTIFTVTRIFILQSKNSFWRAVYFAPFFYGLVGGVLVCFIVFKGSGRAGLDKKSSDEIALASCLTALFAIILSAVYVSWWKVRVDWYGEDIKAFEYPYHFLIAKRPMRAGFDAKHLADASGTDLLKKESVVPAAEDPENGNVVSTTNDSTGTAKHTDISKFVDDVDARFEGTVTTKVNTARELLGVLTVQQKINITADAREIKIVPPVIEAAMKEAAEHGYIVREMGETEKVCLEYKKMCTHGTWYERILMPFRALFCHGICGADGKERSVRMHGLESEKIRHIHDAAIRYDEKTEEFFKVCQSLTSCLASFSHGANDVANAIGPFSVIYGIWSKGAYASKYPVDVWMLAMGGACISLGFMIYGYHLMRTLGNYITYHSPSRGYSMEFGAGVTVLLASRLGIPVSTTQCITGATVGVGALNGIKAVNWKRMAFIFLSWLVTVPVVAIWSGLIFAFVVYSPSMRSPGA